LDVRASWDSPSDLTEGLLEVPKGRSLGEKIQTTMGETASKIEIRLDRFVTGIQPPLAPVHLIQPETGRGHRRKGRRWCHPKDGNGRPKEKLTWSHNLIPEISPQNLCLRKAGGEGAKNGNKNIEGRS